MRFNVYMEDGGLYPSSLVLTSRGVAKTLRDVHCAIKYDNTITVCNSYVFNKILDTNEVYDAENACPEEEKKEESNNTENKEDADITEK